MIWSIVRILLFISITALLTWAATMLLETPGQVRIALGDRELTMTPLGFLVVFLLAMLAMWVGIKLIGMILAVFRYLAGDETAITRYFDRNRERKGFDALTQSLVALAAGDTRKAQNRALQAEKLLDRPELTRLVGAQTAEAAGQPERAAMYYKEMLASEDQRFVGVQGLLRQKLADGDTETALKLAEKAYALNPRHTGVLDTLFDLQSGKEDWSGARNTLKAKVTAGTLPKDIGRRREAILLLADAREKLAENQTDDARDAAFQANRLAPDLVPAAALAARMHIQNGQPRVAARIIKRAWGTTPHPDLAAAFAAIQPDETPDERLKRFQPLLRANTDSSEPKLIATELALAAEDFPEARRALGKLAETDPSARSLALMAAIEKGEGASDTVVRGWLAKALSAARGETWVCQSCHHPQTTWSPQCENCQAFDSLSWTRPPQTDDPATGADAMLPLIVGALSKPDPEPEPEPEIPDADPVPPAEDQDQPPEADIEDAPAPGADETDEAPVEVKS